MLVKRGKKEVTSFSNDFKSGWWSISLDVVRQAIRAFSWGVAGLRGRFGV